MSTLRGVMDGKFAKGQAINPSLEIPARTGEDQVTWEIIEAVKPDGRYQVKGKTLGTSGIKTLPVGAVVPVVWVKGEPKVILAHSWKKAQFSPTVVTEPGDLQYPTVLFNGAKAYLVVVSVCQGCYAIDLESLGLTFKSPSDGRAKWVEGNTAKACVLIQEEISGVRTQHVIVVQIDRQKDARGIPINTLAKDNSLTLNGIKMGILRATLASHESFKPSLVIARTLRCDVTLHLKMWRFFEIADCEWGTLIAPGPLTSKIGIILDEDGTYTATGNVVRFSLSDTCQEFFATEDNDTVKVVLTYGETLAWRPGDARTSEQVLDTYGTFAASWSPAFSTFAMSFPSNRQGGISPSPDLSLEWGWGFTLQTEPASFPPSPGDFLKWSDDQRPDTDTYRTVTPWSTIFRCPHIYQYDVSSAAIVSRNVEEATVLNVVGHRYIDTTWCVPFWHPNYAYDTALSSALHTPHYPTGAGANGITGNFWNPYQQTWWGGLWGGSVRFAHNPGHLDGWALSWPVPWFGDGQYGLDSLDTRSKDADLGTEPDACWGVVFDSWPNPYLIDPWRTEFTNQMQVIELRKNYKCSPAVEDVFSADWTDWFGRYGATFPAGSASHGTQVVFAKAAATGSQYGSGSFGSGQPPATAKRWIITDVPAQSLPAVQPTGGPCGDLTIGSSYTRAPRGVALPMGLTAALQKKDGGKWASASTVAYRVAIQRNINRIVSPSPGLFTETIELPACQPVLIELDEVNSSVGLSWTAAPDATGYVIYRRAPGESTYLKLALQGGVTYTDRGAAGGDALPTPLGKEGVVTVGGPIVQGFRGNGHLALLFAPDDVRAKLVRIALTGDYPLVTMITVYPTVLRVNGRWLLYARGTTNDAYLYDFQKNVIVPVFKGDMQRLLGYTDKPPRALSIDQTMCLPTAQRLMWLDPDRYSNRRLLDLTFDAGKNVYRWFMGDAVQNPVSRWFPASGHRTGALFPKELEGKL